MSEREKLKKRLETITQGFWRVSKTPLTTSVIVIIDGLSFPLAHGITAPGASEESFFPTIEANASFIADAPEIVAALLSELEAAERERDKEAILKKNFEGSWRETDNALLASEAALRTLRQAAERVIEEFHDPELELRVGKIVLENLAAALAAEGGK